MKKIKLCIFLASLLISLSCLASFSIADTNRSQYIINEITTKNKCLQETNPDLLNYKYCKMSADTSPFPFYRATNYLFWQDLANDSRLKTFGNSKTQTWLSGDLHAENLGVFDNDLGEIIFDINDFDESIIADYQYDIWRMATSIVLVARDNQLLPKAQANAVDAFTESYLDTLASYRGNKDELKTYFTQNNTEGRVKKLLKNAQGLTRQAMLNKWVTTTEGKAEFKELSQKLEKAEDKEEEIKKAMKGYGDTLTGNLKYEPSYFRVKSVAKRVDAGLGSLGIPRYYVLIEGNSKALDDDRILDIKLQNKSTAYEYLTPEDRQTYDSYFKNDAERHSIAYQAFIKHPDDHLGWLKLSDGYYSVREISPYKKSLNTAKLNDSDNLLQVTQQWGKILATDHASSDQDFNAELVPYSLDKQVDELTQGHHQDFKKLVQEIAFKYADQVKADYDVFVEKLKPQNCTNE